MKLGFCRGAVSHSSLEALGLMDTGAITLQPGRIRGDWHMLGVKGGEAVTVLSWRECPLGWPLGTLVAYVFQAHVSSY